MNPFEVSYFARPLPAGTCTECRGGRTVIVENFDGRPLTVKCGGCLGTGRELPDDDEEVPELDEADVLASAVDFASGAGVPDIARLLREQAEELAVRRVEDALRRARMP